MIRVVVFMQHDDHRRHHHHHHHCHHQNYQHHQSQKYNLCWYCWWWEWLCDYIIVFCLTSLWSCSACEKWASKVQVLSAKISKILKIGCGGPKICHETLPGHLVAQGVSKMSLWPNWGSRRWFWTWPSPSSVATLHEPCCVIPEWTRTQPCNSFGDTSPSWRRPRMDSVFWWISAWSNRIPLDPWWQACN